MLVSLKFRTNSTQQDSESVASKIVRLHGLVDAKRGAYGLESKTA